jgi:hypothetical protein
MRVPKEHPHKLLRSVGGEDMGVIQATDVARIRAFRDFLSQGRSDGRLRRKEIAGRAKNVVETHIVTFVMISLGAFSDFFVFRLTGEGPTAATVCAGSAWGVRIRSPISSKAQMQALAYVECIGCRSSKLGPEPAKKRQYLFSRGIDEGDIR